MLVVELAELDRDHFLRRSLTSRLGQVRFGPVEILMARPPVRLGEEKMAVGGRWSKLEERGQLGLSPIEVALGDRLLCLLPVAIGSRVSVPVIHANACEGARDRNGARQPRVPPEPP
jgi:hypothetical protein